MVDILTLFLYNLSMNYATVRFRKKEVIELLRNLPSLKEGKEDKRDLAIELEIRLDLCSPWGLLAKEFYTWEESLEEIASAHKLSERQAERYIVEVISYISGWRRKKRIFKHQLQHKGDGKQKRWQPPKGAKRIDGPGYIQLFVGLGYSGARQDGWILEHRLVMQKKLGRPLHPWEKVHHIDRNKQNNDELNLQVMSGVDHPTCLHCPYYEFYIKHPSATRTNKSALII